MKKDDFHSYLESNLKGLISKAFDEGLHLRKNDPSRVRNLRISSYPFCGLKWFLSLPGALREKSFIKSSMHYYVTVGSLLHEVMQSALQNLDLEGVTFSHVADWYCSQCKKVTVELDVKPSSCPKCGNKTLLFREVTVKDPPILGHIDSVFKLMNAKLSKRPVYVVLDYKSISLKRLSTLTTLPTENCEQIRAYANEIKRRGLKVADVAFLVYIPRDSPFSFEVKRVPIDFDIEEAKRARYVNRFLKAASVDSERKAQNLVKTRPCAKVSPQVFKSCPRRSKCEGSENTESCMSEVVNVYNKVKIHLPLKVDK